MAYLPSNAIPLPGLHSDYRNSINVASMQQLKVGSPAHSRRNEVCHQIIRVL